jgi:hypothetical protein
LEILASMIAFFALVASWFVLPAAPRSTNAAEHIPEGLPTAA